MNRKKLTGILVTCIVVAVTVAVVVRVAEVDNVEVTFPDANLEAAIREAIDISEGPIYAQHLEGLASLSASARNITSLTGLEYCTGLRELLLQENGIGDVSPLLGNLGLGEGDNLDLRFNPLSEESMNEYIPELELRGVGVLYDTGEAGVYFADPDLEAATRKAVGKSSGPIYPSDLRGLTELVAYGSNITDLTGPEGCTRLTKLRLGDNQISDVSALAGLTNLTDVDLAWNQISDILPLAGLTGLTQVRLRGNWISDISPLSGLTNLTDVNLDWNLISDISPLSGLTGLTDVDLQWNLIDDISALAGLTGLTHLNLSSNRIGDISPLVNLTELTYLNLYDNQVSNCSALAKLTSLARLELHYNEISDISSLVDSPGLSEGDFVDLRDNPLNEDSLSVDIPELEARRVNVDY